MRDHSAENEGFAFGKDLEDTDIAVFTDESIKCGFLVWDKQYHDEMVVDGTSRSITITFSDGSQKETSIYAEKKDYPKTWDEMREAFINLTGEDVLWQ